MITDKVNEYLQSRIPPDWFIAPPKVSTDDVEILVIGPLDVGVDIAEFRERTRERRMEIAEHLERKSGRKVAWGVEQGEQTTVFTSVALPVMTRLRLAERRVLDTLVDGGVARSRADAVAWCVKLVAQHEGDWLKELRDALSSVATVRDGGPSLA